MLHPINQKANIWDQLKEKPYLDWIKQPAKPAPTPAVAFATVLTQAQQRRGA